MQSDGATLTDDTKAFPSALHIPGASIELHADGTWSGDREQFLAATKNLTDSMLTAGTAPMFKLMIWLVANTVRNHPQRPQLVPSEPEAEATSVS